ncbi:UPF0692 protein C19orf54-like [Gigantopelta aegis]|uniref:UPF0692 protein C19orf54-like n=1 Tax=Gigantopelta aegis TaxID=1735272 RepID=UPI001B88A697|nr:UPF0692 protein C19orf54-like [Gigantopelta aegis]
MSVIMMGEEGLPPAPPPPPPPSPVSPQRPIPGDNADDGSVCTQPIEQPITKEISSHSLGCEAYELFHKKQSSLSNSAKYCYISFYQPVSPILQNGPACGIVALAMSASLLGKPHIKTQHIFNRSRELNVSKQGELFSVEYMKTLAQDTLHCPAMVSGVCGDVERQLIVKSLLQGAVLLIPYDSDKNHRPCLKKGHKAHWALITGFFLVVDHELESTVRSLCSADPEHSGLYHCSNPSSLLQLQHAVQRVTVYAQQGKSKYPGVWPLEDLLASTTNLTELDPDRAADSESYVIPHGGVLEGLCGRIVILTKD